MASVDPLMSASSQGVFPNSSEPVPDEVVLRILSFLTPCDYPALARVSRTWQQLAGDDALWKPRFQERFPEAFHDVKTRATPGQWRELYKYINDVQQHLQQGRCAEVRPVDKVEKVLTMKLRGDVLMGLSWQGKVFRYHLGSGESIEQPCSQYVRGAKVKDHKIIGVTLNESEVFVWNGDTQPMRLLDGQTPTDAQALCLKVHDNLAVIAKDNHDIDIWDHTTETLVRTLHNPFASVISMETVGDRLFAGMSTGHVCVWDMSSGELLQSTRLSTEAIMGLKVSDGRLILLSQNGKLRVRKIVEGRIDENDTSVLAKRIETFKVFSGHVITGSRHGSVAKWNMESGMRVYKSLADDKAAICRLAVKENWIFSGASNGEIRVLDVNTGAQLTSIRDSEQPIRGITWDDGKLLSLHQGGLLQIRDFKTCTLDSRAQS